MELSGASYKEFHENAMKNNNGTTPLLNFLTIVPSFFTTFFVINLVTVLGIIKFQTRFLIEFFVIIFSIILNVTILNDRILEINITLFILTIVSAIKQLRAKTFVERFVQIPSKRPEYVDLSRATINLITAVCILAVDFQIFPRTLAKTETFGFGLMDVGVGLFVFSNGIISPDIRQESLQRITLNKFKSLLINSSPLIILGLARFFVTNQIDYQMHVSEYGVHWNFFITLAFTKIFGTIVMGFLTDVRQTKYAAIIILIFHELFLQMGLANYVFDIEVKRDNFFNANREGIISIPGYVALYLGSVYIGYLFKTELEISKPRDSLKIAMKLGIISLILWKLIYVCDEMFGVSRRLSNMGYVIWILSIGVTMTTLFILLEVFYYFIKFENRKSTEEEEKLGTLSTSYVPIIMKAINYNGLVFFLVANLLTGFVNIIFKTLLMNTFHSLMILTFYMLLVCVIMTFLYINKIKLKIW